MALIRTFLVDTNIKVLFQHVMGMLLDTLHSCAMFVRKKPDRF